ncbi:hypothetical protein, partial [Caulobacter sp. HMWF009]
MSRSLRSALCVTAFCALASTALAQPVAVTRPNVSTESGPVTVDFAGLASINHGLVGAGRLSAALRDFNGDSLGSFSSMAISDWKRLPDGSYAGTLTTLPDRGPNAVGTIVGTSDYANRLHRFSFTFAPYAGAGPVA